MTCFANTTTKHDVYVLPLPDIFVLVIAQSLVLLSHIC